MIRSSKIKHKRRFKSEQGYRIRGDKYFEKNGFPGFFGGLTNANSYLRRTDLLTLRRHQIKDDDWVIEVEVEIGDLQKVCYAENPL